MGRKPKPKDEKVKCYGVSFTPDDWKLLNDLSESMGVDKSKIIRYLLRCCAEPSNQGLRNLIVNLITMEKMRKPRECTNSDYHTSIKTWTSYGDERKTAPKDKTLRTVDQHHDDKSKDEMNLALLRGGYEEELRICKKADIEPPTFEEWLEERNYL